MLDDPIPHSEMHPEVQIKDPELPVETNQPQCDQQSGEDAQLQHAPLPAAHLVANLHWLWAPLDGAGGWLVLVFLFEAPEAIHPPECDDSTSHTVGLCIA